MRGLLDWFVAVFWLGRFAPLLAGFFGVFSPVFVRLFFRFFRSVLAVFVGPLFLR